MPGGRAEVAQLVGLHAGKPDQHGGVIQVVVRDVVGFRIFGEEGGALFKIGADDQGSWLRRPVDGETHHQPLAEFERRRALHGALLEVWELASQGAHRLEIHRFLWHPRPPIIGLADCSDNPRSGLDSQVRRWCRV